MSKNNVSVGHNDGHNDGHNVGHNDFCLLFIDELLMLIKMNELENKFYFI